MVMKTFDLALSFGASNVTFINNVNFEFAPNFFANLSWYLIGGELVGFGSDKVVAPFGGKFINKFEYNFLGWLSVEFGFQPVLEKYISWEPFDNNTPYYEEWYAVLTLKLED